MEFKAAIFDFDGTLADSMWMWKKLAVSWAKKYGMVADDAFVNKIMYSTFEESVEYFIDNYNIDLNKSLKSWTVKALFMYLFKVREVKGAKKYLERIKKSGRKIAVASNCSPGLCRIMLRKMGIYKYIDADVYSFRTGKGKNEPDIYLKAAELLAVKPEECMVYEDSPVAIEGVRRANMKLTGIYVPGSSYNEFLKEKADMFIRNYEGLNFSS